MKRKLFVLSFAFAVSLASWSDNGVCLLLRSGKVVGFSFKEKPVVVTGAAVEVRTSETTVSYDYSEVARLYFDQVIPSGITSAPTGGKSAAVFSVTPSGISVNGLSRGERVYVHTSGGMLVSSWMSSGDAPLEVSLPQGGREIYIVSTEGGVTFKVAKR